MGGKASEIRVNSVERNHDTGTLVLSVENGGAHFGRLTGLEVQGVHRKVDVPGFPLFPGKQRRIELTWEAGDEPRTVAVRLCEFSVNYPLVIETTMTAPLRGPAYAGVVCLRVLLGFSLWLLSAVPAKAQAVQVQAGSSSLFGAHGASIVTRGQTHSFLLGAGRIRDRFTVGALMRQGHSWCHVQRWGRHPGLPAANRRLRRVALSARARGRT